LLPQLVDTYILSNFLFYLVVLLASFVSMTLVLQFFELIGDMIRNKIPLVKMFTYLFFLTRNCLRHAAISILVAVLVAFGVLSSRTR